MIEWIQTHKTILGWLAVMSGVTFIATLVAVPFLVIRIPSDYFVHRKRHKKPWGGQHPVVRGMWLIGKNVFGYIFIAAGIAMLVLPGQGMLTILVGIILVDFPGQYRLGRWLVSRRPMLRSINWLRRRAGRAPLVLEKP